MNRTRSLLALALFLVPAAAMADSSGFDAALGAASFDTSIERGSADSQAQLTLGYRFDERLHLDLTAPAGGFDSTFEQAGFGPLIKASFEPYTLSLNYSLRPHRAFNPFVGVGYTRFSIDTEATGLLAGLDFNAKSASGLTVRAGADYQVTDRWFVRGEASATQADLTVYAQRGSSSSKIVDEAMDPVSVALSVGYRF